MKRFSKMLTAVFAALLLVNAVPACNFDTSSVSVSASAVKVAGDANALDRDIFKQALTDTGATIVRFVKNQPAVSATMPLNAAETVLGAFDAESKTLYVYAKSRGKVIAPAICNSMFYNMKHLTEIDCSALETGHVTDMGGMFEGCSALTGLDLSGVDTSNVTTMFDMFRGCVSLTALDLSSFDTGSVKSMHSMFNACRALTTLDLSNFDTSKVTDMRSMFCSCSGLTELDISGFDTGSVTEMDNMFNSCEKLTRLDVSGFETGSVRKMDYMFYDCYRLTALDVSGFDTGSAVDMSGMFGYCTALSTLDVSGFQIGSDTDISDMFVYCRFKDIQCSEADFARYVKEGGLNPDIARILALKGDVNHDGEVNDMDATAILMEYAATALLEQASTFTSDQTKAADVDGNGTVDTLDATFVLRYFATTLLDGKADWAAVLTTSAAGSSVSCFMR